MSRRLIVGILGGMGPEATADLFEKVIRETPAHKDQDHLHVVIDSRPQVPDRTAAVFGEGEDPTPELVEGIRLLVGAGANLIAVPCNTAHCFYAAMQEAAGSVRVLHMMREVASELGRFRPPVHLAGLLATTGTVRSLLYHEALAEAGLQVITPDDAGQKRVMQAIYDTEQGIKAGHYEWPRTVLQKEGARLVARGAEVVIAGCTELPLALGPQDVDVPYIDATLVLARAAVNTALGTTKGGESS